MKVSNGKTYNVRDPKHQGGNRPQTADTSPGEDNGAVFRLEKECVRKQLAMLGR